MPLAGGSDVSQRLSELEDPHSQISGVWQREHNEFISRQLLRRVEPQVSTETWQAFKRSVLDGDEPVAVAEELGMSRNSVYIARSRVLRQLRREGRELLE